MEFLGILWNEVFMRPMINSLTLLYDVLFDNFGLSIIVFTVLMRVLLIPLQVRQTRQTMKMQELQPKMKALQDKYKGKSREDKQQLSKETMRLYRETGVNPVGCLGPLVIQMPIWIALYRAILRSVPPTPEGLANLSEAFYWWNPARAIVPLDSQFAGMDLVDFVQYAPAPLNFALPVLVGGSMWVQQKMMTPQSVDPRQAQTNQIMLWMMPIMFGFFTLQFPAGLGIYILFSNLIGVAIQYFVGGRKPIMIFGRQFGASGAAASVVEPDTPPPDLEESSDDEQTDLRRKDSRKSDRPRPRHPRRQARRRRNIRR